MGNRGLTLTETLSSIASLVVLLALLVPALGQRGQSAAVSVSGHNLRTLHAALECYAADWNNRQFTAVPDDFGVVGGNCALYGHEFGCYPPLIAGIGCNGAYWGAFGECPSIMGSSCINYRLTLPMNLDRELPIGIFRLFQVKPVHDYLNGKFYDPVFYAPLDTKAFQAAFPAFDVDCEFVEDVGTIPSSYVLSAAAMFDPAVFRAPSEGGFQHPDTYDDGYRSPPVTLAKHPSLKTWIMEHSWLRNPPGECNPAYEDPWGGFSEDCDPYLFNHGADAEPLTVFFDGTIEPLRTGDVFDDDAEVLKMTGGVDGLWSRDTPFGPTGYFGDGSFDGTVVSHHILTTGGILGRDRLGDRP